MRVLERETTPAGRKGKGVAAQKNAGPGREQEVAPTQDGTVPIGAALISFRSDPERAGHLFKVGRAYPAHKAPKYPPFAPIIHRGEERRVIAGISARPSAGRARMAA